MASYYSSINKVDTPLQELYKKYGVSVLEGMSAPIELNEYIINSHKQWVLDACGIYLPPDALRFGRMFYDSSYIYYGVGDFDCWQVTIMTWDCKDRKWSGKSPTDKEYFEFFIKMSKIYGANAIWNDFWQIFIKTNKETSDEVLKYIHNISQKYGEDSLDIEKKFTVIYLAMVSEENKKRAPNGKLLKALGMYQILFLGKTPWEAATYSRGKDPSVIRKECSSYGIYKKYE